jgi:hypothetical protein
MTTTPRRVFDRTREPWLVEEAAAVPGGGAVLRFRHELGYELVAVAPRGLDELGDEELTGLLEKARRRPPRGRPSGAA